MYLCVHMCLYTYIYTYIHNDIPSNCILETATNVERNLGTPVAFGKTGMGMSSAQGGRPTCSAGSAGLAKQRKGREDVYIYIYIFIYLYVHIFIHIHIYIYIHAYI